MKIRFRLAAPILSAGLALCGAAQAQRANENPLAAARDAFGTTVGTETIGLYTARDVRGFDPVQVGNVRLEGLYFDRQQPNPYEIFPTVIVTGSTVRVGLSAQSYPFPAPSGIADVKLRIPGEKRVESLYAGYGAYNKVFAEVDAQVPVIADTFSLGLGVNWMHDDTPYNSRPIQWSGAITARWQPVAGLEIIPFWSRKNTDGLNPRPNVYTGGDYLPPEIHRHTYYGPAWSRNEIADSNFGVITNAAPAEGWLVRAGLFRSMVTWKKWSNDLFQNTQPSGAADQQLVIYPPQEFGSISGEVRVSRLISDGDFTHTIHIDGRGRVVTRFFGGADTRVLGPTVIGVPKTVAPQSGVFTPTTRDRTVQGTGGIAYNINWKGFVEFGAGLQKTSYRRTLNQFSRPAATTSDTPFLYNATLAIHPSDDVTLFGSYTRGLEDSGQAPNNAVNRGEAAPAARSSQIDAGFRYAFTPRLSAVAAAFEIKKPYFNVDQNRLFTQVGQLRHRGVEFSLAGQAAEGLTIVAGTVVLEARISGDLVNRGIIGPRPVGRFPRVTRLNLEYGPPSWSGLSFDTQVENLSKHVASLDNHVSLPMRTTLAVGARYRFKLFGKPAMLRVQGLNMTDVFGWDINAQQLSFEPAEPRRVTASLTVDF